MLILVIVSLEKIAIRWMWLDLTDDKSTLVQVMAWCRQATSHYLSQCWPRSLSPYRVIRPQWVNHIDILRPEQNGQNFADNIYRLIFLYEKYCILIKISPKFLPDGPINTISALVQVMRPQPMTWIYDDRPMMTTIHAVIGHINRPLQHIEVQTKWPPFCRQHFQAHFCEWKSWYFSSNIIKLCS